MSWLSKLFGGGGSSNPADAAQPYLNQIPGVAHQGYDPYINRGLDAGGKAQTQYDRLLSDPTGFINEIMKNYKESDSYNFAKDRLTKEMGNTAAAGGIAGTPLDQMNQAEGVQGLLSKDMQQYLQNALGVYGTGLSGEQGLYDTGFNASSNLTDALGGALNQQAGLAFQGQQQKNMDRNAKWNMLAKALGIGAGAFFGGLPGAAVGSRLGG